jgi:aldehyde:ferredoxin oxidoreductase
MKSKLGGYAGKLLRVDLSKEKIKKEELSKEICMPMPWEKITFYAFLQVQLPVF